MKKRDRKKQIIIQKFGGSSLNTALQRECVAATIINRIQMGYQVVAVFSAMGRFPSPYATDSIIASLREVYSSPDRREQDAAMSCGEILSCIVMASLLRSMGQEAEVMTGFGAGIVTDNCYGDARILSINARAVKEILSRGAVVCVTGFQGITRKMEITTLGRGGSDTTATALGAALKASEVEIFTDVDGVLTVDPQTFSDAEIIRELAYQEMGEMANEGAKVLHSRCVDLARAHKVPLWVKGSFSDDKGSFISSRIPERARRPEGIITGLIHRTGLAEFETDFTDISERAVVRKALFESLAKTGISLDLINLSYHLLYFTVKEEASLTVSAILQHLDIPFRKIGNVAKISCVGIGMKGTPGVMARICEVFAESGIRILRSVDSYINISCLIEESQLLPAISALHERFCQHHSQVFCAGKKT
ncbi:MAG: aspartate kinase [Candidatus Xenobiia bacterium LiM19]